jgi:transcriptional regulator with XRE-family HTH domain
MTQVQVARKSRIDIRGYQRYECGEQSPNVKAAIRIARVLGTTVEALFGDRVQQEQEDRTA